MDCISDTGDNCLALNVYVQPRASRNRLAGLHGGAVKLCVTAPPVENKANSAVIDFVSDLFTVPKSSVSIKNGRQARKKMIIIKGLALKDAQGILHRALSKT